MNRGGASVFTLSSGVALGALCGSEIAVWLGSPGLLPSTALEGGMFALMLLRVALFLGIPRLRRMSTWNLIILFSGDVLILPVAGTASLVTGDQSLADFGRALMASWLSLAFLLLPSLAAFLVVRAIAQNSKLSYVLPAAAGCFGISSLVLEALVANSGSGGLQGVMGLAFAVLKKPIIPLQWTSELLLWSGVLLFASLAAYSVTASGRVEEVIAPKLTMVVSGVLVLIAWILVVPPRGTLVTLGLPSAVIVGILWVMTRET